MQAIILKTRKQDKTTQNMQNEQNGQKCAIKCRNTQKRAKSKN